LNSPASYAHVEAHLLVKELDQSALSQEGGSITERLFAEHDNPRIPDCRDERFSVGEVIVRNSGSLERIGTAFFASNLSALSGLAPAPD
jgi:hypothetical protein